VSGGRLLDIDTTLALIRTAAQERCYLAYVDVAFANGAEWARVRRHMRDHLVAVCRAALEGGPLVSSIVVNRRHVGTGAMEPETLAGFLAAARDLGFAWDDGQAFRREQQAATFRWATESKRPPG